MNTLYTIITTGTIYVSALLAGCQTLPPQQPVASTVTRLTATDSSCTIDDRAAATKQEHNETFKGKIVRVLYDKKNHSQHSFALQKDNKTYSFVVGSDNKFETERIIRLLEVDNYVDVDVNENKLFETLPYTLQSKKLRQGAEPEAKMNNPVLEQLLLEAFQPEKETEKTSEKITIKEYISIEGVVVGRTYRQLEQDNKTSYLFAIQTKDGIKIIKTTLNDSFEAETMSVFVQPRNTVSIRVEKGESSKRKYEVLPVDIGLKILDVNRIMEEHK